MHPLIEEEAPFGSKSRRNRPHRVVDAKERTLDVFIREFSGSPVDGSEFALL